MRKIAGWLILFVLSIVLLSCSQQEQRDTSDKPGYDAPEFTMEAATPSEEPIKSGIEDIIGQMTLEEKIGQLFFISYRKDMNDNNALKMDNTLKDLITRYNVGGFVLFSENISEINQTLALIHSIEDISEIPPFISIDEEGGIVTRLNKSPELKSTRMPENYTIGLTNKPQYAYEAAKTIAQEIKSLGFNMNFAPVADIFTNQSNTVIGKRAFGTDPAKVAMMVSQSVKGFQEEGIIPVLKHFPGHGDTLADSHTGAAMVDHDLKRLTTVELIPFQEGIESGADVIMTAHILLPNITKENVPASLSKEIINDILRGKLDFDGVVITDAFEMSAISDFYDDGEAVVKAIDAGVDMILMPESLDKSYTAVLNAVSEGKLTEARIDESVRRILSLKHKYHLFSKDLDRPSPDESLGSASHIELADKIRKDAKNK